MNVKTGDRVVIVHVTLPRSLIGQTGTVLDVRPDGDCLVLVGACPRTQQEWWVRHTGLELR